MSIESLVKDIVVGHTPIMNLLTGGAYTFEELGMLGLSPNNPACVSAFEKVNGLTRIRPCVIIKVRSETADFERHDVNRQITSYTGYIEFWLYQYSLYTVINAASDELDKLFTSRTYAGVGLVRPTINFPNLVSTEFDNVSLRRNEYSFKRIKKYG